MNFIDPTGTRAGDVWLYGHDNSRLATAIVWGQETLNEKSSTEVKYTHASIELANGVHFSSGVSPTRTIPGSHLENGASILDRMVDSRTIDIYRHMGSDQFAVDAASKYAEERVNSHINIYGINGVCSTETAACSSAGGISLGTGDRLTSPADISNTPGIQLVGRYDHERRQSIPIDPPHQSLPKEER